MSPLSDSMDPLGETDSSQTKTEVVTPVPQTSPLDLTVQRPDFSLAQRSISNGTEPASPMDASTPTIDQYTHQISTDAPTILIQPKSQWHYRSVKDLAKKHIPLIAGEGPQRTPLRVAVPPKSQSKMYLAVQAMTVNGENHDSKVIVPHKTKAAKEDLSHSNDLRCLKFAECEATDCFDLENKIVYLEITDKEHANRSKDVRVHMFNLYQNQHITKDLIENKHLHLCQLAFSFCLRENNEYERISQYAFSSTIEEKKPSARSRVLQSASNQLNMSVPSQVKYQIPENDDNANDSDDNDDDFSSSASSLS